MNNTTFINNIYIDKLEDNLKINYSNLPKINNIKFYYGFYQDGHIILSRYSNKLKDRSGYKLYLIPSNNNIYNHIISNTEMIKYELKRDEFVFIKFNNENSYEDINIIDFEFLDINKDNYITKDEFITQLPNYFNLVDHRVLSFIINYNNDLSNNPDKSMPIKFETIDEDNNNKITIDELLKGKFSFNLRNIDKEYRKDEEYWPHFDDNPNIFGSINKSFKGTPKASLNMGLIRLKEIRSSIKSLWADKKMLSEDLNINEELMSIKNEEEKVKEMKITTEDDTINKKSIEDELQRRKYIVNERKVKYDEQAIKYRKKFLKIFGDGMILETVNDEILKFSLYFYMRYLIDKKGIIYYINLEDSTKIQSKAEHAIFNKLCTDERCKYIEYDITDHDVISIDNIKYLVRIIEEIKDKRYRGIMHCFAGMGRTGYIILCYLLKEEKKNNTIDFYNIYNEIEILIDPKVVFSKRRLRKKQLIEYGEDTKLLKDFEIFKFIWEKYNYNTAEELFLQEKPDLIKEKLEILKLYLDSISI